MKATVVAGARALPLLLVSGATATMRRIHRDASVGRLFVPRDRCAFVDDGRPWAIDNGAFSQFDERAFVRLLDRLSGKAGCLFAAVPDAVADPAETLRRFRRWAPRVSAAGFPLAFVLQDGARSRDVPWGGVASVFVGGSTAWKLSDTAGLLMQEARRRGKWVHVGRVNSRRRIRAICHLGAQSLDGTGCSRYPDTKIPAMLRWLAETRQSPRLF